MNFSAILTAIQLVGAATPAFQALFEQVLPLFNAREQDELKRAYAEARARSDTAHEALQQAARDAGS